jgi:hypothetical protein
LHIACHSSPAGEINPLGQFPGHAVGVILPDETIRAGGRLLSNGRFVELGSDFFTDKMDGREYEYDPILPRTYCTATVKNPQQKLGKVLLAF